MSSRRVAALVAATIGLILVIPLANAMVAKFAKQFETSNAKVKPVPVEYREFVLAAGELCPEISPSLIAAQINAESAWNPEAVSPVGAEGISQFMPTTWSEYGRDGNGDGEIDVFDPADAIISQGHLMCANLTTINKWRATGEISGDPIELALAAYNAGPGAVHRHGGIPPFPETENYIAVIHAYRAQYQEPEHRLVPRPTTTASAPLPRA